MSRTTPVALAAGLALALVGLAACGDSDFDDSSASEEELRKAFDRTGLQVCSEEAVDWDTPGFEAGVTFEVSRDCADFDTDDNRFQIVVSRFENKSGRDHAEKAATTLLRPMRNASAWTYGPYLIVLEGEKDEDDYDKAVDALEDIGAE